MDLIFWIHFAATWAMIGANAFVSSVHYPGFKFLSEENFGAYEKFHIQRALRLAIPIMCIEAATAILLLIFAFQWLFLTNAVLIALIWFLTFHHCLSCHLKMRDQFCSATFDQLSRYHNIRFTLWVIRGLLLFTFVH